MTKAKVLLIEDDPDQILLYTAKFTLEGLDLISAKDGLEGLVKARDQKPDFILCDIVMDDMNGWTALEKLKSDPRTEKIPVVLLTNFPDKGLGEKAEKLGAAGLWAKTEVLPQDLVERVERILKMK